MPLWVRPGSLVFPETPGTPIIMVGPGTGVAPFRAAIQERVAHGQMGEYRSSRAVTTETGLAEFLHPDGGPMFPRKRLVLRLPPAGSGLLLAD